MKLAARRPAGRRAPFSSLSIVVARGPTSARSSQRSAFRSDSIALSEIGVRKYAGDSVSFVIKSNVRAATFGFFSPLSPLNASIAIRKCLYFRAVGYSVESSAVGSNGNGSEQWILRLNQTWRARMFFCGRGRHFPWPLHDRGAIVFFERVDDNVRARLHFCDNLVRGRTQLPVIPLNWVRSELAETMAEVIAGT